MAPRPVAIDLFAGCGGLSTGLREAGFSVRVAVEIDAAAAGTYRANHRGTAVIESDIRKVGAADIRDRLGDRPLTLIAGCAPCQGFSTLTSKWRRSDPRNELLLDMARIVEDLRPEAILMENVPGVATKGKAVLAAFLARIRAAGYYPTHGIVQMADYGVPQLRRRFVMLAGRGFAIPLPSPTHAQAPGEGDGRMPWVTVREAIGGREPPARMDEVGSAGPRAAGWHVVRALQPQTRARLKAALPGATWTSVDEALRPKCHRGGYVGFTNVYGRMRWDRPSVAITSGCTTPAKGRFGHPDRRRTTISVREAAILQSFPPEYDFATDHIDEACELVGNAVPPRFAAALGTTIVDALERHRRALASRGAQRRS